MGAGHVASVIVGLGLMFLVVAGSLAATHGAAWWQARKTGA